jgi:excisionase family DNA binding protein
VADILDLSEDQVLDLAERREIPAVSIGGQIRFRKWDVELAISAHTTPALFEMGKTPDEIENEFVR